MKVKDVLARIGDSPLRTELESRGYTVLGDDDEDEAIEYLDDRGIYAAEGLPDLEEGWLLWRSGSSLFPEWLRKFFWIAHGRNP